MAAYTILIKSHDGNLVHTIKTFDSLQAGRADRSVMPCELLIPKDDFIPEDFTKDMIMEVHRTYPAGVVLDGETGYFLRYVKFFRAKDGTDKILLKGYDSMYLLDAREVEYAAESSQASKTGVSTDIMKEIVDENFLTATDSSRNWPSTIFKLQGDDGSGASITDSFSRQYVLPLLQKICNQSRDAGSWVTFDVFYDGSLPFQFKTYSVARGVDRSASLTLSVEAGNLSDPSLEFDWTNERTVAYLAGKGEKDQRLVGGATDPIAGTSSLWSFREVVSENFQLGVLASLQSGARSLLDKYKAKVTFSGTLVETEGTRYGYDWAYGDLMKVSYLGYEFIVRVLGYHISCNSIEDKITAVLRSV